MTEIETTINEAIEGEYNIKPYQFTISHGNYYEECCSFDGWKYSSRLLLDPKFWQAVGKTRGWSKYISAVGQPSMMWKSMWHRFIDHLADGLTIEEALTKLR